MPEPRTSHPPIVSLEEWQAELEALRVKEKEHTRAGDALAAARRRLPMVPVDAECSFEGEGGDATLLDLFNGEQQLIVYHFMFGPDWEEGCDGCSWVTDAMSHPAHLRARGVSMALVSRAPIGSLMAYRDRMGWNNVTWYSSAGSAFNEVMGATIDGEEHHGLSVFLRLDDQIYRTYYTSWRGIEHLGSHWTYLDMTPFGRKENWEESPPDWPQSDPYSWQRRHDEYEF